MKASSCQPSFIYD